MEKSPLEIAWELTEKRRAGDDYLVEAKRWRYARGSPEEFPPPEKYAWYDVTNQSQLTRLKKGLPPDESIVDFTEDPEMPLLISSPSGAVVGWKGEGETEWTFVSPKELEGIIFLEEPLCKES